MARVRASIPPRRVRSQGGRRAGLWGRDPNQPNHFWTSEQREMLLVLDRWFAIQKGSLANVQIPVKVLGELFNSYFSSGTRKLDVAPRTVHTQLSFIKRHPTMYPAYQMIYVQTSFDDHRNRWATVRQRILTLAQSLHIPLKERVSERSLRQVKTCKNMKQRPHAIISTSHSDGLRASFTNLRRRAGSGANDSDSDATAVGISAVASSNDDGHDSDTTIVGISMSSPNKQGRHNLYRAQLSMTARMTAESFDSARFTLPRMWRGRVAFRFYDDHSHGINTSHGFWSGDFEGMHLAPPPRHSEYFEERVKVHLIPLNEKSSFISLWQSMVPALNRALRSRANAHIAIIDLDTLGRYQDSEFPRVHCVPSLTKKIIISSKKGDLDVNGQLYRGWGECLVWQHIPARAVIADMSIADLYNHLLENPALQNVLLFDELAKCTYSRQYEQKINAAKTVSDHATGNTIGKFLRFARVPDAYVVRVSNTIRRNWKMKGRAVGKQVKRDGYLKGTLSGFNGLPGALSQTPNTHCCDLQRLGNTSTHGIGSASAATERRSKDIISVNNLPWHFIDLPPVTRQENSVLTASVASKDTTATRTTKKSIQNARAEMHKRLQKFVFRG